MIKDAKNFAVFIMKAILALLVVKFLWVLVIPFIYLFGHFSWFQEIMVIVADLIDTVGLFYLLFGITIAIVLYRNFTFQIFLRNSKNWNFTALLISPSLFFTAVKNFFQSLLKKLKSFFNKKK